MPINLSHHKLLADKIVLIDYNLNHPETVAYQGNLDQINIEKRHRAIQFIDEVEKFPELEFHRVDSERHNYHLLAGRMLNGKRDIFIEEMAKKGVQCVVQYCPLNRYDFYQKMGYGKAICPSTDLFYDNMVSFPFHHIMSDESFDEMIAITKKVLSELV